MSKGFTFVTSYRIPYIVYNSILHFYFFFFSKLVFALESIRKIDELLQKKANVLKIKGIRCNKKCFH